MSDHLVVTTDEVVRGRPGTVSRCTCGWKSAWGVQDGSAEADAHGHRMRRDEDYRKRALGRVAEYNKAERERGCTCKLFEDSYGFVMDRDCVLHGFVKREPKKVESREPCHGCSCHINPPCGACENCVHWDIDDCENDCQTCTDHEEEVE